MQEIEIGSITVRGQTFGVYVDSRKGRFYCNIGVPYNKDDREHPNLGDGDPDVVEAKTMDDLKRKAQVRLENKVKVEIECWQFQEAGFRESGGRLEHGVVTGMHANGNAMVKWDSKTKTEQVHGFYNKLLKLDTNGEREEFLLLHRLKVQAQEAFDDYAHAHQMDAEREVSKLYKRDKKP